LKFKFRNFSIPLRIEIEIDLNFSDLPGIRFNQGLDAWLWE
jgi:hypothetical protein